MEIETFIKLSDGTIVPATSNTETEVYVTSDGTQYDWDDDSIDEVNEDGSPIRYCITPKGCFLNAVLDVWPDDANKPSFDKIGSVFDLYENMMVRNGYCRKDDDTPVVERNANFNPETEFRNVVHIMLGLDEKRAEYAWYIFTDGLKKQGHTK